MQPEAGIIIGTKLSDGKKKIRELGD